MKAKDFRKSAHAKIKKKCWGALACVELIVDIILGICAGLNRFYVGWIGSLILGGPLTYGQNYVALAAADEKAVKVDNTFIGFKHFGSSLVLNLLITIFTALWSLLLVIPGIIMSHAYAMSYFILIDNPDLAPNEARKQSIKLMKGYKWKLFCLRFSYIGWYLLSILTLGILLFWVIPYERTAEAEFYRNLVAKKDDAVVTAEPVAITSEAEVVEEATTESEEA